MEVCVGLGEVGILSHHTLVWGRWNEIYGIDFWNPPQ